MSPDQRERADSVRIERYRDLFRKISSDISERKLHRSMKKKFKKLHYIPLGDIDDFLVGQYDPSAAVDIESGMAELSNMATVHDNGDSYPLPTGIYTFAEDCGTGTVQAPIRRAARGACKAA